MIYNGISYAIIGTSIPLLEFQNVPNGTAIVLESGRNFSYCSVVNGGTPAVQISTCGMPGTTNNVIHFKSHIARFVTEVNATDNARLLGEDPVFTKVVTTADDVTMGFTAHNIGTFVAMQAENGAYLCRQGSFFLGIGSIVMNRVNITGMKNETQDFRSRQLGIRYYQRISGSGLYFLEVQGDVIEKILPPKGMMMVDPKLLIAMPESVTIDRFASMGEPKVRKNLGMDFMAVLVNTADIEAKIFLSSQVQKDHIGLGVS